MRVLKQGKRFVFTLHKEDDMSIDDFTMLYDDIEFGAYGGCQLEQCPESLRYHIQGWCCFKTNQRPEAMKALNRRVHWQNMMGTIQQSIEYCSKNESRVEPYRTWGEIPENSQGKRSDLNDAVEFIKSLDGSAASRMKKLAHEHPAVYVKYFKGFWDLCKMVEVATPLPALEWYEWQDAILQKLAGPVNRRKITWIHDQHGNRGKSYLTSYLVTNPEYQAIELCGKVADMAYAYNGEKIVLFDIVRSQAEHIDHLYDFAERLKNGRIFSGKYEARTKIFAPPHIVFFANFPPDFTKWSQDRYEVISLDEPFTPITLPPNLPPPPIIIPPNPDDETEGARVNPQGQGAPDAPLSLRVNARAAQPTYVDLTYDTQASTVPYTPGSTQLLADDIDKNIDMIFTDSVIDLTFLD